MKPISVYDAKDKKLNDKAILLIPDLLSFEINNKRFVQIAIDKIERELLVEAEITEKIENGLRSIIEQLQEILIGFNGEYEFNNEWNLSRFVKSQELHLVTEIYNSSYEKLLSIINYTSDLSPDLILVFMNLKILLSEYQIKEFYRFAVSKQIHTLLLEVTSSEKKYDNEKKLLIDDDFVELLV